MKISRVTPVPVFAAACAVLAALASMDAAAQAPARTLADCRKIVASDERLACYDAVSAPAPGNAPTPGVVSKAVPPETPGTTVETPPHAGTVSAVAKEATHTGDARHSMIDQAWDFDPSSPAFDVLFYRPNYFLVGRYSDNVNEAVFDPIRPAFPQDAKIDSTEAKFQISFKSRLWATEDRRVGLWVAYTQQSNWQVYNDELSRPFRDTNYEPEVFVSWRPGVDLPGGFKWTLLNGGFNHQSNGRTDLLSRSWNRLWVEGGVENGNFAMFGRAWYRLKEDEADDDNPNITDYLGHAELSALYRWRDNTFTGKLRGNVSTGKGAVEVAWHSPPILGKFRGYVQLFSGYGETLLDYNWRQTTIGAGVSLSDGL